MQLFERLAPLGIMGDQLRASLKHRQTLYTIMVSRGLRGLSIGPPLSREVFAFRTADVVFSSLAVLASSKQQRKVSEERRCDKS